MSPSASMAPSKSSSPKETCYRIVISITYDEWPEEVSWDMKRSQTDGDYLVLKSYSAAKNDTVYTDSICLQDGDYTFTIYDEMWDGICGDYEEPSICGHYNITSSSGDLIAEGGEFERVDIVEFSVTFALAQPSQSPINWLNLFPG